MSGHKPPSLSTRERQLLRLAASGLTDVAIAHKLDISPTTVKTYWGRLRAKLGRSSRTELVAHVLREEAHRATCSLKAAASAGGAEALAQCNYYRLLVEHAPDAMLVLDADGVVRVVNAAALELFGYTNAEIVGQHLASLVPERFRDKHRQHVADYMTHPRRHEMAGHVETFARHKTGFEIGIEANLAVANHDERASVICAIRRQSSVK